MCGVDFVMCGSFRNTCTCIYCVLYCLHCVFVLFRLCILFVLSVLVSGLLQPSENWIAVSNNNNNNNNINNNIVSPNNLERIWHLVGDEGIVYGFMNGLYTCFNFCPQLYSRMRLSLPTTALLTQEFRTLWHRKIHTRWNKAIFDVEFQLACVVETNSIVPHFIVGHSTAVCNCKYLVN